MTTMMERTWRLPSVSGHAEPAEKRAATGYLHPDYAASLAEFGRPRELPACGGWLLERSIPGSAAWDAMGCYPIFTCRRWERLPVDLAGLAGSLVTLVLVTEPFAEVDQAVLESCFDFVKPFKRHYVADLTAPLDDFVSKHHRYYRKRARCKLDLEVCEEPYRYAREWIGLYDHLVQTHNIRGLKAFSPQSLQRQLHVPGMVLIVGRRGQQVVGAHLVAIDGDVAYSHLAASSSLGYEIGAAYGIYGTTLDYLAARGVKHLDLGGAAGLEDLPTDGLSQFKRGWSNATRLVYLCGRVLDPQEYGRICEHRGIRDTEYFPAYRAGEFQ
jgi:hypothetical protein